MTWQLILTLAGIWIGLVVLVCTVLGELSERRYPTPRPNPFEGATGAEVMQAERLERGEL